MSKNLRVVLNRSVSVLLASLLFIEAMPAQTPSESKPKLNLVILEGEGAINNVRKRMARAPIVRVEDENHKPIAGVAVTFLLPRDGAGATFADGSSSTTVVTDKAGRASAQGMRPNAVAGSFQIAVTASYQGLTQTAVVTQSNALAGAAVAGAGAGAGLSAKAIALIVVAGAVAATGGAIAATRGGGDKTQPAAISISAGAPAVGAPR